MNLHLTEEQKILLETVSKLFREESGASQVRLSEGCGFNPQLWTQLVELGLHSMLIPEKQGGAGFNLFDAAIVAEEAGRRLVSVPFAEALTVGSLLSVLTDNETTEARKRFLDGEVFTIAPSTAESSTPLPFPSESIARHVIWLKGDQVILTTHHREEGMVTAADNLGAMPISKKPLINTKCSSEQVILGQGDDAKRAFLVAIEKWKLLTAAMLVGLGRQALEMAAAYSRDRIQFDKPIGSYQGIAHPLADALTAVDGAKLLVWHAIWSMSTEHTEAAANISMAYWWSTESVAKATTKALRTFGGYGVSVEYDIQLYYRRGMAWSLINGDPNDELLRLANRLWGNEQLEFPNEPSPSIEFDYGPKALQFAQNARKFFAENLTAELKKHAHHSVSGFDKTFNQQLAKAGYLFPHWPEKFGGQGRTIFEMAALAEVYEEFGWERITAPITNQVAQIVMQFGCKELQEEVLSLFAKGEALACLGFTEPESGSDVFACKTKATRSETGWVINGQKIFTTAANLADYVFLLTRTDPDGKKHAGLTMFLVPMDAPGVDVQGVNTIQDERTNITYFSNVQVPEHYRLGDVNQGIKVMAATLELEHGGNQYRISYQDMVDKALRWACTHIRNGKPVIEDPYARIRLAKIAVHTRIAKVLCQRAIWAGEQGLPGRAAYGPMSKLFSTEFYQRDASELMKLAAPYSLFSSNRTDLGSVELGFRQSVGMTIYGGSSEIHRSIIAEYALGMPRSRS